MPLRDHFRPPVSKQVFWEEIHAMWPARLVLHLRTILPKGFSAGPRVHSGPQIEVDVSAYERDPPNDPSAAHDDRGRTPTWAAVEPSVAVEIDPLDYDEYEVRVYDAERGRTLVAAIELVSPANKDRAEKRNAFVAKCAALLQKGVAVNIVDVVTTRQFNLYTELLAYFGHSDPTMTPDAHLYAASCRLRARGARPKLETWSHVLTVGTRLPTLPLWLSETIVVPLDLEPSYEQACGDFDLV